MHNSETMKVTFWGVRGSHPQCKSAFDKVGGHTSCVTLELGDQYLILDAGTGIIDAGNEMMERGINKATLMISHTHADHIGGLAFFKPLYNSEFELSIIASGLLSKDETQKGIESVLAKVMSPPYFPIPWNEIPCTRSFIDVPIGGQFSLNHLKISTIALDHPGGSSGYRIDWKDKSICYITDTSHTPGVLDSHLIEFIQRTHLMIYDSTFTEEEFALKSTWGHSTWNQGVALAKAAAIGELALFHHDPEHDDIFMADIECQAQKHFSHAFVARQGMIREI